MSEDRVICTECGKEVSAALKTCEECGARNFHGRPVRSKFRKGQEPKDTHVAPLTDAMRVVPRSTAPKKQSGGRHRKKRDRRPSRDDSRTNRRLPSVHSSSRSGSRAASSEADATEPPRMSRRKIYRYDNSDRPKGKYSTEIRAVIGVIVAGLALILICRLAEADDLSMPTTHPPDCCAACMAASRSCATGITGFAAQSGAACRGCTRSSLPNSSALPTVPYPGGQQDD